MANDVGPLLGGTDAAPGGFASAQMDAEALYWFAVPSANQRASTVVTAIGTLSKTLCRKNVCL
jgi:hypothetical protein